MRDSEWVAHKANTGHSNRLDVGVPEGWYCREKDCKAQSRSLEGSGKPSDRPRNIHCSNCGNTSGGPVGHEISECTWAKP